MNMVMNFLIISSAGICCVCSLLSGVKVACYSVSCLLPELSNVFGCSLLGLLSFARSLNDGFVLHLLYEMKIIMNLHPCACIHAQPTYERLELEFT
jgi:hypothetical protein